MDRARYNVGNANGSILSRPTKWLAGSRASFVRRSEACMPTLLEERPDFAPVHLLADVPSGSVTPRVELDNFNKLAWTP
jgi:hypothetical protein